MTVTARLRGVDAELDRIRQEFRRRSGRRIRRDADALLDRLRDTTPVDTGRARAGWRATTARYSRGEWRLTIENDVPYIVQLNMGSSRQAPRRFVETAALRYFTADGVIAETR